MKKNKKNYLLECEFSFTGDIPNLFQVNEEGILISNIHKEVSKVRIDGTRFFSAKIQRAGLYRFKNFKVPKDHFLYSLFGERVNGRFSIDENKKIVFH